jgi:hypothetical protein
MKTLYVAWQQPDSKEWIPVARLNRSDGKYRFVYTRGVHRARDFQTFSRMDQIDAAYESETLFPLFANRLISRSRPEFRDYLRWMGLTDTTDDPMSILALTGGIRGTDSIELFQPPVITEDGRYELEFFARSLSFLPKESLELINKLELGTRLYLMNDRQNAFDSFALALRSESPIFMAGYCPKYYAKDIGSLLEDEGSEVTVRVKCINPDAPLNMRLFCSMTAKPPAEFLLAGSKVDFEPVANHVPRDWENLTVSLQHGLQVHD